MSGVTPHHSRLFLRLREVIMCLEILQSTTSVLWTVLCHQSLAAAREANIVVRGDRVLIRGVSVISLMTVEITLTRPTVIIISLGKMLILQLSKLRSNCWIRFQPRSFPIKYTIEPMVYCSHLPNMVSANWLWRLAGGQGTIRNGEIFWSNNNVSCTLLNYSVSFEYFFNVQCRCTFERSLCRWTQLSDDDFDWTRNQGSTASYGTGPMFDHTLGSAAGNPPWHSKHTSSVLLLLLSIQIVLSTRNAFHNGEVCLYQKNAVWARMSSVFKVTYAVQLCLLHVVLLRS